MNDTQRIDALDEHGLCIVKIGERIDGEWSYRWVCHFGIEQSIEAPTSREAIDLAVETINRGTNQ